MDATDVVPHHILGYTIKSRTRIYVSWIIPTCLELLVYLTQMTADAAITAQHFCAGQHIFGGLTLTFLCAPALVSFILILASSQWSDPKYTSKCRFFWSHLLCTVLFPFWFLFGLSRKLFWSVEALFHDDDLDERKKCLQKAHETSFSELYNFIKAYAQSAPQIILQLYHMLSQDLFRDYQTTTVQGISLLFSTIDIAAITMAYQRFESQKDVGRHYPWASSPQVEKARQIRMSNNLRTEKLNTIRKAAVAEISAFPENDKIFEDFQRKENRQVAADEVDGAMNQIDDINEIIEVSTRDLEQPPSIPAPKPPQTLPQIFRADSIDSNSKPIISLKRMSTFKDMIVVNAELYIKENFPRPPKLLIQHVADADKEAETPPPDETDFFLPHKSKIVNGVEQDDFAGKVVAFMGWIVFITMRMLALSTFAVFYTAPALYLALGHYLFSLCCLFLQTRCRTSWNRILCYVVLAYVYIFVLLEFKVKFKRIRLWYIGYFVIMMAENLTITILWYTQCEFESWWFDFLYKCIMYSGVLFTASLLTYYCILKPKNVTVYLNDD